jgi:Glycosyltransferase
MILAVWRALVERLGASAPKLVLVGTRGWHYDPIVDLIERSPALRSHVFEIGGLSTPALKRLVDNAQAVLMPSFGEGYGLPVHEALTAGAPVVASDIPAFREIEANGLTLLSPLDGEGWLEELARRTSASRPSVAPRPVTHWSDYFASLEGFFETL